jgi:hypothetical protein
MRGPGPSGLCNTPLPARLFPPNDNDQSPRFTRHTAHGTRHTAHRAHMARSYTHTDTCALTCAHATSLPHAHSRAHTPHPYHNSF